MATFYSSEYNSGYIAEPTSKLSPEKLNGRVRRAYAEITLGSELASGDIVKMLRLPANSNIIDAGFHSPAATSGTLDIGVNDADGSGDNADAEALFANVDISAAVSGRTRLSFDASGHNLKINKEMDVEILADGVATVGASGDVWKLEVLYTID